MHADVTVAADKPVRRPRPWYTQLWAQSLKIFWSKASLGLRRGVVVGKIGMATSHLAVER